MATDNSNLHSTAASLKAITYRLSTTPTKQLPKLVPQIASSLWNCRTLLSLPADTVKRNADALTVINRFKAHLSTLLQDRTVEGRWAAVVLVNAAIEAGGVETLSKASAWVRNLLAILKKTDPPTTRILATATLTRIFMLTWEFSNLIREITTPVLPGFVGTCLSNVENNRCSSSEFQTVLESFATLIPRHPTIFRTNEVQIQALLRRVISDSDENRHFTHDNQLLAQRISVLLHHCAPKQGFAHRWDESFKTTIAAAHVTCDRLFRSVVEDWQSTAGVQQSAQTQVLLNGEMQLESDDLAGFPGWSGVNAGSQRLVALIELVKSHLHTATGAYVTVRLGLLVDLVSRVLGVTARDGTKYNSQIAKDEREAMFLTLATCHIAAIELIEVVLIRFGKAVVSMLQPLLSQVTWVFESQEHDIGVRSAVYGVLNSFLVLHGPTMAKEDVADIEPVIKSCCEDLVSTSEPMALTVGAAAKTINGDIGSQVTQSLSSHIVASGSLAIAAELLLPTIIAKINPTQISGRRRTQLEQTAILTQKKDALVACVLNPASNGRRTTTQASLLPLLARQFPNCVETELLLRPRMPVIRAGVASKDDDEEEVEEEEEEEFELHGERKVESAQNGHQEDETKDEAEQNGEVSRSLIEGPKTSTVDCDTLSVNAPYASTASARSTIVSEKRPAPAGLASPEESAPKRPRTSTDIEGSSTLAATPAELQIVTQQAITPQKQQPLQHGVPVASSSATFVNADDFVDADDDEEMIIPTLIMEDSSDEEE